MKENFWIDSHFHPQYFLKTEDGQEMTEDFKASITQISQGLMVAVKLEDRALLEQLSIQHRHLHWSLGLHPCDVQNLNPDYFMKKMMENPTFDAIGETGLDLFHNRETDHLKQQHVFFERHIECAHLLKKPLIVHTRDAGKETLGVLSRYKNVRGVIHCFTESLDFAKKVLDLGWMISFSGILTFPKAQSLRDVASYVPMDAILIETDAPYLAPNPFRGKQNQPSYVQYVGEQLCEIKAIKTEICQRQLAENYQRFLHINQ